MVNYPPHQLVTLAYSYFSGFMLADTPAMNLILSDGQIKCVHREAHYETEKLIMHLSKRMLREGFTSEQWNTLEKNMVKHQKEIND